jgi:putative transposase
VRFVIVHHPLRGTVFLLATDLTLEPIEICMDGKGRWRDNVLVERVWKSIKYEEVYPHAYESVQQAKGVTRPLPGVLSFRQTAFQPGAFTPDQVYFNCLPESLEA